MEKKIFFATATTQDSNAVSNILEQAFKVTPAKKTWLENQIKLFRNAPGDWRTMVVNERVIGTIHVRKNWLKIGKGKILKGDVGGVSILPEYHGKGYGTALMHDTIKWMKSENYDISRLGGLVEFYSRFGYLRFPRRYMEFFPGNKVCAGASVVEEGYLPLSLGDKSKIRPYDESKDFYDYLKLHNEFYELYNAFCPVVPPDRLLTSIPPSPNPLRVVFEEKGHILGYLFAGRHPAEYNKTDKTVGEITIEDIAYEKKHPEVLDSLLRYINNLACDQGLKTMTARIPFDPEIIDIISRLPVQFQCNETYGGKAANMLQIINLHSLFERLIPELEARLEESTARTWNGIIQIKLEKDKIQLLVSNGTIKVTDSEKPTLQLVIKEIGLLKLILGMYAFNEITVTSKPACKPLETALLRDLFPRQLLMSSNWG
ncbi:MAG: GNAT family N-acetyltransferase [Victivallaceae bacterium]|nr:GNAT family N-acetyltransferase [Victivallaceae bacterium]